MLIAGLPVQKEICKHKVHLILSARQVVSCLATCGVVVCSAQDHTGPTQTHSQVH